MEKYFDRWNAYKKRIDTASFLIDFHERDLWWCSIGVNIGSEQQSQTGDFSRPVLVVKRFTRELFWGVPLTTKIYKSRFRVSIVHENTASDILIMQMRCFDKKRLRRRIGMLSEADFKQVLKKIEHIIKYEIPLSGEISEAEASV